MTRSSTARPCQTTGGTVVWVAADAKLSYSTSSDVQADFLSGSIYSNFGGLGASADLGADFGGTETLGFGGGGTGGGFPSLGCRRSLSVARLSVAGLSNVRLSAANDRNCLSATYEFLSDTADVSAADVDAGSMPAATHDALPEPAVLSTSSLALRLPDQVLPVGHDALPVDPSLPVRDLPPSLTCVQAGRRSVRRPVLTTGL